MIVYFFKKSKGTLIYLLILTSSIVFVGYLFFVLEKIDAGKQVSIQIIKSESNLAPSQTSQIETKEGIKANAEFPFVASKRGVYYYPINCSKAKSLSVKNMLYFKDKTAAEGAGYKPHSGC